MAIATSTIETLDESTGEVSKELKATAPEVGAAGGLIHHQNREWCGKVSVM
ncbi:MAG: hypothetical protein ACM3JB_11055 [Acidobacteriaceae bacterium]